MAYLTKIGLIEGFPNGTFRGNQPVTRYQAAEIFYRLLTGGLITKLSQKGLRVVVRGMQQVSSELAALMAQVKTLSGTTAAQQAEITALTDRINAMNANDQSAQLLADFASLKSKVDSLKAAQSQDQRQTQTLAKQVAALTGEVKTIEQVQAQAQAQAKAAASAPATPAPAPKINTSKFATKSELSDALSGYVTKSELAALQKQVDQLKAQVATLASQASLHKQNTTLTSRISGIQGEVTTLQSEVKSLQKQLGQMQANLESQAPSATTSTSPSAPATTVVLPAGSSQPSTSSSGPNAYLGVSGGYPLSTSAGSFASNLSAGVEFGLHQVFAGFGLRGGVSYNPTSKAINGEVNATYQLAKGTISPYIGLGGGLTNSAAASGSGNALDFYADGILGASYQLFGNFGLFAELNPRYYFSANGTGHGTGFNVGLRAGLQYSF